MCTFYRVSSINSQHQQSTTVVPCKNYLTNEASSSDSESCESEVAERHSSESKATLPSFGEALTAVQSRASSSSVWANPYLEAEQAKRAILEKHVKLSEADLNSEKARKVCYKFLKGKCRFGKNCKFMHDGNISHNAKQGRTTESQSHVEQVHENVTCRQKDPCPSRVQQGKSSSKQTLDYLCNSGCIEAPDEVADNAQMRKRRVGVGKSLIPPKKAMQAYQKQQAQEQPWLSH